MQKKVSVIALSLAAALALAGCANDGTRYRADTYYAGQVNQVQEVNTVQIIAVNAARVAVPNDDNRDTARMVPFSAPLPAQPSATTTIIRPLRA